MTKCLFVPEWIVVSGDFFDMQRLELSLVGCLVDYGVLFLVRKPSINPH